MCCPINVENPNCDYPLHEIHAHHAHSTTKSKMTKLMDILEKVGAIALGVFAAFTNIRLFIPFFLVGVGIGIYNHFTQVKNPAKFHSAGCSQGVLEQLPGANLPGPLVLAGSIAVAICHIEHHDTVFVPIVATYIGAWLGKMGCDATSLLYHKICNLTTSGTTGQKPLAFSGNSLAAPAA